MSENDNDNKSNNSSGADMVPPHSPIERTKLTRDSDEAHEMRMRFVLELVTSISSGPADAACALTESLVTFCVAMQVPLDGIVSYFQQVADVHASMTPAEQQRDFDMARDLLTHCMERGRRTRENARAARAEKDGAK